MKDKLKLVPKFAWVLIGAGVLLMIASVFVQSWLSVQKSTLKRIQKDRLEFASKANTAGTIRSQLNTWSGDESYSALSRFVPELGERVDEYFNSLHKCQDDIGAVIDSLVRINDRSADAEINRRLDSAEHEIQSVEGSFQAVYTKYETIYGYYHQFGSLVGQLVLVYDQAKSQIAATHSQVSIQSTAYQYIDRLRVQAGLQQIRPHLSVRESKFLSAISSATNGFRICEIELGKPREHADYNLLYEHYPKISSYGVLVANEYARMDAYFGSLATEYIASPVSIGYKMLITVSAYSCNDEGNGQSSSHTYEVGTNTYLYATSLTGTISETHLYSLGCSSGNFSHNTSGWGGEQWCQYAVTGRKFDTWQNWKIVTTAGVRDSVVHYDVARHENYSSHVGVLAYIKPKGFTFDEVVATSLNSAFWGQLSPELRNMITASVKYTNLPNIARKSSWTSSPVWSYCGRSAAYQRHLDDEAAAAAQRAADALRNSSSSGSSGGYGGGSSGGSSSGGGSSGGSNHGNHSAW